MKLSDLINGNKTAGNGRLANANPANLAKVDTNQAETKPRLATLATLAIAENELDDIFNQAKETPPPAKKVMDIPLEPYQQFEQGGAPVTCRFWYQVCHAVGIYQEQCTRDTACKIHRFLMINSVYRIGQ